MRRLSSFAGWRFGSRRLSSQRKAGVFPAADAAGRSTGAHIVVAMKVCASRLIGNPC